MRKLILMLSISLACSPAHAANFAVVDTNGVIVNRIVMDQAGDIAPAAGTTFVQEPPTTPYFIGGTILGGVYTAPQAPALPPSTPALPTSVQVNSTSTPALSGVYAFDAETQSKILAVSLYIQVNAKFPAGHTSFPWPDVTGTMHVFTSTAQFQALASALADYATALDLGQTPTAPVTIP